MGSPKVDAKGRYAPLQADREADGVHRAKPIVITGWEDATIYKKPQKPNEEEQQAEDEE